MQECVFCKIVAGEIPANKVYEDDMYLAFLDISPVNPGHALVIPKAHYPDLPATPDEVLSGLAVTLKKVAAAIMKAMGVQGFNVTVNNGSVAGQVVEHVHFHVIPRLANDGQDIWHGKPYAEGEATRVADKTRSALK